MSKNISKRQWIIAIICLIIIVSYSLQRIQSNFVIGMWSGIILYGIVYNFIGSVSKIREITEPILVKTLDIEFDRFIISQVVYIIIILGIVSIGSFIETTVSEFITPFTNVQRIGLVIILSRLTVSRWHGNSISAGEWYKTIYLFGLFLILVPFLQLNWVIPDGIIAIAVLSVVPSTMMLILEHQSGEPDTIDELWDYIKSEIVKVYNIIR